MGLKTLLLVALILSPYWFDINALIPSSPVIVEKITQPS